MLVLSRMSWIEVEGVKVHGFGASELKTVNLTSRLTSQATEPNGFGWRIMGSLLAR